MDMPTSIALCQSEADSPHPTCNTTRDEGVSEIKLLKHSQTDPPHLVCNMVPEESVSKSKFPRQSEDLLEFADVSKKGLISSIYIQEGREMDDISSPTIPETFEDDISFETSESNIREQQHLSELSYAVLSCDDADLSMSSMNTKAMIQITELKRRLRIQENSKLTLLNQCLELESRLEKNDTKNALVKMYKMENNKLRDTTAQMERRFMNDTNDIVRKMAEMEADYEKKLDQRDQAVRELNEELKLLRITKNLDHDDDSRTVNSTNMLMKYATDADVATVASSNIGMSWVSYDL